MTFSNEPERVRVGFVVGWILTAIALASCRSQGCAPAARPVDRAPRQIQDPVEQPRPKAPPIFESPGEQGEDAEAPKELEGPSLTSEQRTWIEKGKAAGWGVVVSPKKNYVIVYNTKNGKNQLLAKVIAERVELIREQIYEKQFPSARPIDTVSIVRICEDRREYIAYGGPAGSVGYWNPHANELVFYDASPSKKVDDDTLSILHSLAFEQYFYYAAGSVAPHAWFIYGHGDYYAGAKLKGGALVIKPFAWRVGVMRGAIAQGQRTFTEARDAAGKASRNWEHTGYTPLRHFVRFGPREYSSYSSVSYAQGWSLIYFLREIVPTKDGYETRWGRILETYFETLKAASAETDATQDAVATDGLRKTRKGRGTALESALDAAFKNVDWDEFEAAWVEAMNAVR